MDNYALRPIGYVRNGAGSPESIPYNGSPSRLELLPEYLAAARGLEPGYVWILTWLHQSAGWVTPESIPADTGAGSGRGPLASRSPRRPNPIAITAARLLEIDGGVLIVDALDLCDGTPLLDIKPYVREFDCIFGPADPAWRRAAEPAQRLARIVRTTERFCGPLDASLALAARLAAAADTDLASPANSPLLTWECRCSLRVAAGIQAVAGTPLGSPRFILGPDEGTLRVSRAEAPAVIYRLLDPPGTAEVVLSSPEADLWHRVVASR